MGNTHRGFRTVNVLTTGAGRAVYVNAQVGWVNFDIDIVINFWVNERRAKGGMTAAAGIERALTHQAVNAGFSTQPAVGVIANDFDGHRFNARDFTVLKPRASAQRRYMRISMLAQSWASVPPEPA